VKDIEKKTYEEAMARLDEIINLLENNKVSSDDSIALYQEGVELARYCDAKLKSIENQVTKIYEDQQLKDYEGE
jgi:exodeoxyribonuclease VII small subunit